MPHFNEATHVRVDIIPMILFLFLKSEPKKHINAPANLERQVCRSQLLASFNHCHWNSEQVEFADRFHGEKDARVNNKQCGLTRSASVSVSIVFVTTVRS